ncbi:MAG: transposase [Bacteroidetes bacterium]|nr:transposase [Bacteroidota bacterium]
MLPDSFPLWPIVFYYQNKWKKIGLIHQVHEVLREKVRIKADREVSPSAVSIDSQSVKTGRKGGIRGIDGGKKVKGKSVTLL